MSRVSTSITPFRPTASALADRGAAADYREANFPPTVAETERTVVINMEGQYVEPGILQELFLPVGQGIRAGTYQNFAIGLISSDPSSIGFASHLAKENQIPLFLAGSVSDFSEHLRPIGDVTQSEIETFELVQRMGGNVTGAALAAATDLEPAAANNRLSNLAKKGYLFRISRSRREGDVYVTPHIEAAATSETQDQEVVLAGGESEIEVPSDIRDSVASLAAGQGVSAAELLTRAWREYFLQHSGELQEELQGVRAMISGDDKEALLAYTSKDVVSDAEDSMARARHRRQQRRAEGLK